MDMVDGLVQVPGRAWLDTQASQYGIPVNSARLVAGLMLSCVLAPFTHLVPTTSLRHACNLILGILLAIFVFDLMVIHSLLPTLSAFLVIQFAPRKFVGKIVAALTFAYLIATHVYREYFGADIMWDGAQMVLTLKLVGAAISYTDGTLPEKSKTPVIMRNQLLHRPSILFFFGYIYFFPTFLVGPIFEYDEYVQWTTKNQVAPFRVIFLTLFRLLVCIGGYGLAQAYFPISQVDLPTFYPNFPLAIRFFMQLGCVHMYKYTFFMVWQFGELGGVLAGYGYNETTKAWDGLTNNNILLVEFPTSLRVMINNWNMKVAMWLNTYVYQRFGWKNNKPTFFSTLASFFVSALWHGLLPGYYFYFFFMGLTLELGKYARRRFRPYFHYTDDRKAHPHAIFTEFLDRSKAHPLSLVYDLAGLCLTHFFANYYGMSFATLAMKTSINVWSGVYFLPHIFALIAFACFLITEPKQTSKSKSD